MSSIHKKEMARLKKEKTEAAYRPRSITPDPVTEGLKLDPNRLMPDWWYVYQIKKRLEWPKCEDRETVIDVFQRLWPRLRHRAEEYYDTAAAEPRTADEILRAYSVLWPRTDEDD